MSSELAKGVAKNTSIMLGQQAITWASTFLLMMFLPRYLGPAEYGKLFLASSITDIFKMVVAFGATYYIAKNVSRDLQGTDRVIADAISSRLVLAVGSIGLTLILISLMKYNSDERQIIMIFAAGLLAHAVSVSFFACYQGHEKVQFISAASISERVFASVIAIGALLAGAGALVIAIVLLAATILNAVIMAVYSRKIVKSIPRVSWKSSIRHLREGIPYFFFAAFGAIYYRVDSILLSKMAPDEVVGWYGASHRLFDTLTFFPAIVSVVVYPVLSRLSKTETLGHRQATQRTIEYIIVMGVPVSASAIVFARPIVQLLYGTEGYEPSILVLQILGAGLLTLYVDMILGTTLLASDRQRAQSILAFCAIPFNIGLNLILIPLFQERNGNGGIGAAVSILATELGIMAAMLTIMPRGLLNGFRFSVLAKSLAAGVFMWGAVLGFQQLLMPLIVQIAAGLLVFAVAVLGMKTLSREEIAVCKQMLAAVAARMQKALLVKANPADG